MTTTEKTSRNNNARHLRRKLSWLFLGSLTFVGCGPLRTAYVITGSKINAQELCAPFANVDAQITVVSLHYMGGHNYLNVAFDGFAKQAVGAKIKSNKFKYVQMDIQGDEKSAADRAFKMMTFKNENFKGSHKQLIEQTKGDTLTIEIYLKEQACGTATFVPQL